MTNALLNLQRYKNLAKKDYGSAKQVDDQASEVSQMQALLQGDEANLADAKNKLNNATLISPISGRTGVRLVDVGNIVSSGSDGVIVNIMQTKPISIVFAIPQQELRDVLQAKARKDDIQVDAIASDSKQILASGKLEAIDNQIDQNTGTIKLKATFVNDDEGLWPGQFVNIRIVTKMLHGAAVVPTSAIQQRELGPYVYVVGRDKHVKTVSIVIASQDEKQTVISSGLKNGDLVVTAGFARLSPGSPVEAKTANGKIIEVEPAEVKTESPPAASPPAVSPPSASPPAASPSSVSSPVTTTTASSPTTSPAAVPAANPPVTSPPAASPVTVPATTAKP